MMRQTCKLKVQKSMKNCSRRKGLIRRGRQGHLRKKVVSTGCCLIAKSPMKRRSAVREAFGSLKVLSRQTTTNFSRSQRIYLMRRRPSKKFPTGVNFKGVTEEFSTKQFVKFNRNSIFFQTLVLVVELQREKALRIAEVTPGDFRQGQSKPKLGGSRNFFTNHFSEGLISKKF